MWKVLFFPFLLRGGYSGPFARREGIFYFLHHKFIVQHPCAGFIFIIIILKMNRIVTKDGFCVHSGPSAEDMSLFIFLITINVIATKHYT